MLSTAQIKERLKSQPVKKTPAKQVVTSQPFHKKPLPKIVLLLGCFLPLFLLGLLLVDRPRPIVAQKNPEPQYSSEQINELNQRIRELQEELYETKSSSAFLSERERVVEPVAETTKPKPIALAKLTTPLPPPPPKIIPQPQRVKNLPTVTPRANKPQVMGAGKIKRQVSKPLKLATQSKIVANSIPLAAEESLLQEIPMEKIKPGQSIKAVLSTPILISGGRIYNQQGITIVLLEPLTSSGGKVLVAKNTEVLVRAQVFASSSLVEVNPISFMGTSEFGIPSNSISILGHGSGIEAKPLEKRDSPLVSTEEVGELGGLIIQQYWGRSIITNGLSSLLRSRNTKTWNRYRNSNGIGVVNAGFPLNVKVLRSFDVPLNLAGK